MITALKFTVGLLVISCVFIIGVWSGGQAMIDLHRKESVERGTGYWSIDAATGEKTFTHLTFEECVTQATAAHSTESPE